jgi:FAD/FMN-containing dehydrogenase
MFTFTPGQDGYETEIAGFQTGVPSKPQLVVGAASADDVAEGVRYAAEHDLPVSVQATGHGLREPATGVLISTRRMTGVSIDPARAVARVEAGTTWGAVIEAAAGHGLAPLSGSAPGVGVVGYTLGGGFSLMGRRYGLAADHVVAAESVAPDGTRGTGIDGVVTSLEFGLFPVTTLYGGALSFTTQENTLRAWRDWTADLPDTLTTSLALVPYPDLPMIPEPLRGKQIAQVRVAYLGSPEEGGRLVAPLRALGPVMDTLAPLPFTKSGTIAAEPPNPHAYVGDNRTLSTLSEEAVDAILTTADAPVVQILDLLGGAYAPGRHLAPNSRYAVRALSDPDPDSPETGQEKLFEAFAPVTTGRLASFVYGQPL